MSDESSQKCLENFHLAGKRNGNGGFCLNASQRANAETWYLKQAERVCADDTCVKVLIVSVADGFRSHLTFKFKWGNYCSIKRSAE